MSVFIVYDDRYKEEVGENVCELLLLNYRIFHNHVVVHISYLFL